MREQTIKLIKAYYEAFNAGNMRTFLGMLDDDVIHDINQGGVEVGREAFQLFMDKMNHHYDEEVLDLVVMASNDGKHAAAEFRINGKYKATDHGLPEARGQRYSLPVGAFFQIKNGKVARVTNYYNLQAWMKMVQ